MSGAQDGALRGGANLQPGDRHSFAGVTVFVVPAIHALHPADGYSDGAADGTPPRFVGYVLRLDTLAIEGAASLK